MEWPKFYILDQTSVCAYVDPSLKIALLFTVLSAKRELKKKSSISVGVEKIIFR